MCQLFDNSRTTLLVFRYIHARLDLVPMVIDQEATPAKCDMNATFFIASFASNLGAIEIGFIDGFVT